MIVEKVEGFSGFRLAFPVFGRGGELIVYLIGNVFVKLVELME